jgi:hypothetical protein
VATRVELAAGKMTLQSALIDVLWQERERQRLGLAGGERATASRRSAVLAHRSRLRQHRDDRLRSNAGAVPEGTHLTECGRGLLNQEVE